LSKLPPVGTVPPSVLRAQALLKIGESVAPVVKPPALEVACTKTFPPSAVVGVKLF